MRGSGGPVVHAKLCVPRLRGDVVRRARLLEQLDRSDARLVLVSAAAGSGKTTLATDWLEAASAPRAWLSLDPLDNDASRFRAHLGAALESMACDACREAARALAARAGDGHTSHDVLLAALERLPADRVIVLDDVHVLESAAVLELLRVVLTGVATGPRFVLLTRVDPPLPLAKLRLAGELLEVRDSDLRFTLDETERLFQRLLRAPLEPALLGRIAAKTEGWAAGLRLAAITLERAPDTASAVASFTGSHRIVVDYLLEEALGSQEPALQRFLCATSILPRFTAAACAALLDDPGAEALLQEAEARNLFLVALGGGWYRYHHLFAELLEFRLRRTYPASDVAELRRRASAWFAAQGDVQEALRQASMMSEPAQLLALLDAHGPEMCARSELSSFGRWLRHVPEPLPPGLPGLRAALAWYRLLTERDPDLASLVAAAHDALDAVQRADTNDAGSAEEAWLAGIRLQLDACDAFRLRLGGRLHDAVEASDRALALLPVSATFARGMLLYNAGAARLALVRPDAREVLEHSFETNVRAGAPYLVLSSLALAAHALAQEAGVARARARLDAAGPLLRSLELERLPARANIMCQRGWLAFLEDDLDAAEAELTEALRIATAGQVIEALANAHALLARVAATRGDASAADAHLAELIALSRIRTATLIGSSLEVERARVDVLLGRDDGTALRAGRVSAAVRGEERHEGHNASAAHEAHLVLELMRWCRLGDEAVPDAAAIAAALADFAAARARGVAAVHARTVLVLFEADPRRRWPALDELLRFAAERGFIRPLLDGGQRVQVLLASSLGQPLSPQARDFARRVLERFPSDTSRPLCDVVAPALVVPLTDRELDVLRCLARGSSNKAIARAMFVSIDTVKTHLRHIYGKLGVTDRGSAITRGQELGVLELPVEQTARR